MFQFISWLVSRKGEPQDSKNQPFDSIESNNIESNNIELKSKTAINVDVTNNIQEIKNTNDVNKIVIISNNKDNLSDAPNLPSLKEIYLQNRQSLTTVADLCFGYPRMSSHAQALTNQRCGHRKRLEWFQYGNLDLFEIMNLCTGLGYPMLEIKFRYCHQSELKNLMRQLAQSQNFPIEYISVSVFPKVFICDHKMTHDLEICGGGGAVALNIEIQHVDEEIIEILSQLTRISTKPLILLICEYLTGYRNYHGKFNDDHSYLKNLGLSFSTYSSSERLCDHLRFIDNSFNYEVISDENPQLFDEHL